MVISENKLSKVISGIEILQYLSYEQYEQHRDTKLKKIMLTKSLK